ncbi:MAG: ABC transporter ATP-binding protein [Verrucomicrobiales bacterium]
MQTSDSTSSPPAIEVEALTKYFSLPWRRARLVAVRDLSFSVQPGEVYGLLGPNGSGKSTTLKILLGLVPPSKGNTRIFGRDSTQVASRKLVGFLPENPYFPKYLTGQELLKFYGQVCSVPPRILRERSNSLLQLVGLADAANRRIGGYSKGMLQRIGLAQALIQDPQLVVLDEPTAGVDPQGAKDIRSLLLRLKERGITVLLCSHLLSQVQEVCDRIGILNQGILLKEGPLKDLIGDGHNANLEEFFLEITGQPTETRA